MSRFMPAEPRILRTWDGRILHHNDCTYCKLRKDHRMQRVKSRRMIGFEKCLITGMDLAPVGNANRCCPAYQQVNCACEKCMKPIDSLIVHSIDKETL